MASPVEARRSFNSVAVDGDRLEDAVAGARQPVGELAATVGDRLGDARAGLVELVGDFLAAKGKVDQQGVGVRLQRLVDLGDVLGDRRGGHVAGLADRPGDVVGASFEAGDELGADGGEGVVHLLAALGDGVGHGCGRWTTASR